MIDNKQHLSAATCALHKSVPRRQMLSTAGRAMFLTSIAIYLQATRCRNLILCRELNT